MGEPSVADPDPHELASFWEAESGFSSDENALKPGAVEAHNGAVEAYDILEPCRAHNRAVEACSGAEEGM